jgi:voltage-dependent calcium channel L type alpha-1D
MYDGIRAVGWGAVPFYLMLVCIGNFVILNLFIAILLGNSSAEGEMSEGDKQERLTEMEMQKQRRASLSRLVACPADLQYAIAAESTWEEEADPLTEETAADEDSVNGDQRRPKKGERKKSVITGVQKAWEKAAATKRALANVNKTLDQAAALEGSFLCLGPKNGFRRFLQRLIQNTKFESLIMTLILISSLALAFDTPLMDPSSDIKKLLDDISFTLAVCFMVEACMKIVCFSFVPYILDGWNRLDFIIVLISIVGILVDQGILTISNITFLRALRALRALRPLRMISRAPGMKRVVDTMLACIPSAFNVFLIIALFFLIFAIIGVNSFKGTHGSCNIAELSAPLQQTIETDYGLRCCDGDGNVWNLPDRYKAAKPFTRVACVSPAFNGTWSIKVVNFDTVANAMLNLLEISTTEGWVDAMNSAVDATGVDTQPVSFCR